MASTENSLVMGFVAGLPAALVTPFFDSLRETSFKGRTCLFVSRMTPGDVESLRLVVNEIVPVDSLYRKKTSKIVVHALRWVRTTPRIRRCYPAAFKLVAAAGLTPRTRAQRRRWLEFCLEGLQSLRYEHYLKFICAKTFDQVLITDVRDVIFQGDPFAHDVKELEVVLEDSSVSIGNETFNRRWIKNLYGARAVKHLRAETVSCSGTILGTNGGIRRYLETMTQEIRRQTIPLGSHDQGVHNFLLRIGKLLPVTIYLNEEGPIITVGKQRKILVNSSNQVTNRDGSIPAVIHQYDRHDWLLQKIQKDLRNIIQPSSHADRQGTPVAASSYA